MVTSNLMQNKSACWWEMHVSRNWNDALGTALNNFMPHSSMTNDPQNDVFSVGSVNSAGSFNDAIDSIITGPSCWLELFENTNFGGKQLNIGPNSAIRRLKDFPMDDKVVHTDYWNNQISSYKAYRTQPPSWAESTPASGAISHRFAVHKRDDSVMKLLGDAVSTALLAVPGINVGADLLSAIPVGSVLSSAFDTIWPTGSADTRVRKDMKLWVEMAVNQLGFTTQNIFDDAQLDTIRDGLYGSFKRNPDGSLFKDSNGNAVILTEEFKSVLDVIDKGYNTLTSTAENAKSESGWQVNSLHYMAEFAAIAAICWRSSLYVVFGDSTQNDDPTNDIQNQSLTSLSDKLPGLLDYILQGISMVKDARMGHVVPQTDTKGTGSPGINVVTYYWEDKYTGLTCHHAFSNTTDRDAELQNYMSQILLPNFLNDWDGLVQLVDALHYFADVTENSPGLISIPRQTVKSLTGLWSDARLPSDSCPVVMLEFDPDEVADLAFTTYQDSVDNEGHACLGFQPSLLNSKSIPTTLPVIGTTTNSSTTTEFYGLTDRFQAFAGATGNDDGVSKVSKFVSVCTIDGERGGSIPIGGNRQSNGPGWHCSPPDGSNGVLAGFAAQLGGALKNGSATEGGPLSSIGFIWRYDRVVPKGMSINPGIWLTELMAKRPEPTKK